MLEAVGADDMGHGNTLTGMCYAACCEIVRLRSASEQQTTLTAPTDDLAVISCPECGKEHSAYEDCEAVSRYTFRNRDGQAMRLRGDLTLEDLVRMGFSNFRLVNPSDPIPPGAWRSDLPASG